MWQYRHSLYAHFYNTSRDEEMPPSRWARRKSIGGVWGKQLQISPPPSKLLVLITMHREQAINASRSQQHAA